MMTRPFNLLMVVITLLLESHYSESFSSLSSEGKLANSSFELLFAHSACNYIKRGHEALFLEVE